MLHARRIATRHFTPCKRSAQQGLSAYTPSLRPVSIAELQAVLELLQGHVSTTNRLNSTAQQLKLKSGCYIYGL